MSAAAPIQTERLDLVLLDHSWLQAFVDGEPLPDLGFRDPHGFLVDSAYVVHLRVEQLAHDPSQEPWLLRAMVLRETGEAVGYTNFHAPPDERGMVEIGYQVVPARRRLATPPRRPRRCGSGRPSTVPACCGRASRRTTVRHWR
jgi:hypothetical protein